MFLVNSRLAHFSAAPESSGREVLHPQRRSLSRSYGANLPSSLTTDSSSALGFSPCLPVSVYGTDTPMVMTCEAFLGSIAPATSTQKTVSASLSGYVCRGFAYGTPYRFTRTLPVVRSPSFLHPSSDIRPWSGTGILTRCPSTTPFGLALGSG